MSYTQLVINPGSTSTKVALFKDDKIIVEKTLRHEHHELQKYPHIIDQLSYRKSLVEAFLHDNKYTLNDIDIFVGRGGLLKPIKTSCQSNIK